MNIWIFNHHALTPDMSGGTRHYDFAKELIKRGHTVTIIASSFHYSKYKEMKEYKDENYIQETVDGVNFIWMKTPAYFGNGISRVKNMLSYTYKVLKIIPKLNLERPDIIIGSSVHLFAVYTAYKLSKKYNTPFIMEVRDIWPQTLIDMGISKWHPFIMMLSLLEKFLYKKADKIISNLPYAYKHFQKFVPKEKIIWISNGIDLNNIEYQEKQKTNKFIVSYTGAIGIANNLDILLETAKRFNKYNNILFRIVGEGALKKDLLNKIKKEQIKNISIEDAVPKNEIANILKHSDILYVGLKDSPLYKYGISMNKIYDYMGSGRPIIFSSASINNPIKEGNCGFTIAPDNIDDCVFAIKKLYTMPIEKRNQFGENGYKYVKRNYSIEILTDKLEKILKDEINKYNAKS